MKSRPLLLRLRLFAKISVLVLLGLGSMTQTRAGTLLVEFGETLAGEGPGGLWNRYTNPANINGTALKDSLGVTTPITLSFSGTLNSSANAGTVNAYDNTAAVGNPSWVATTTNNLVAGDLFYTDNGGAGVDGFGEVIFLFSGFTPGDKVSIDFLGSRNTNIADGFYSFSIDGGTAYTGFTVLNPDGSAASGVWTGTNTLARAFDNQVDGYQSHLYMNATDVTLTGTTLRVKARDAVAFGGDFAALNAMRVTVVPEPASAVLLCLGAVLSIGGVRRRRQG